MTFIESDPQLQAHELAEPLPWVLVFGDLEMFVYGMPDTSNAEQSATTLFATDRPEVFARVLNEGIGALEDGEFFHAVGFAGSIARRPYVTGFRRIGDQLLIDRKKVEAVGDGDAWCRTDTTVREPLRVTGLNKIDSYFDQETAFVFAKRDLGLSGKGAKLESAVQAIGFGTDPDNSPITMPFKLAENIQYARKNGIDIPVIRFFAEEAEIGSEQYVGSWAEGEYPASLQPSYFVHDLLNEHYRPLVVFRTDALKVGQLYAKAVQESEAVTFVIPSEFGKYVSDAEQSTLPAVVLSGMKKSNQAAYNLDNFTFDLSEVVNEIDKAADDPNIQHVFNEFPSHRWRYMPQMVQTILESPQREEFVQYLHEIGSAALNEETNEFSYQTYVKEIFVRAQEFWEITPRP